MKSRRVVITGMGVVAPSGIGKEEFWNGLLSSKSFISKISTFDASEFRTQIAGEIKDFDPKKYMDPKSSRRYDRYTQLGVAAAKEAIEDANLNEEALEKAGVIVASGIGGIISLEKEIKNMVNKGPSRVSPFLVPMMIADTLAGTIATIYGAKGPNFATVSACASSAHAMITAANIIQSGQADVVITGGAEAPISPISVAAFGNMKALSARNDEPERASRPFDVDRDGFVMGEGAGILVFESLESALKRGAKIYAEVKGYGMSADAYHMVQPDPEGRGAAAAMKKAIEMSGLPLNEIDYVNAHGTSTPVGDVAEMKAVKNVFGEDVKSIVVNSNKSQIGHLLGAAGAVEFVASILSMNNSIIPPTVNLENKDPQIEVNCVANEPLKFEIRNFISNSFGFGGHNASVLGGRFEG
ncbi:beta-ketoacyl-ACP synthase II [Mesoaciditoga lauensis]|uniref:beta-ketoacyl-ACP synthase II n=1 Tax=Mesoaciditoga lauensis TaxID=1495039 RepID=UPI0009DE42FB|nr:beta-ketoacyl-ACP synthase II [Mesoaciditoga lauensis]